MIKNKYLLTMKSHWFVNQVTYKAILKTLPMLTEHHEKRGVERMPKTPIHNHVKRIFPDIYRVPLFRRQWCNLLCKQLDVFKKEGVFEVNPNEDELRQIPEILLQDHMPEVYENLWYFVRTILNPIFIAIYQRNCADISSIQIANYNIKEKQQGAWHHDESADISVVVPLNTDDYKGGGTEFHSHGVLNPLPNGHALIFPSFTNLHRGLAVDSGDRYLLVFWLYDKKKLIENYNNLV